MRKYLSTLLVASVLIASCSKDAEVIREKIVSQSRPILSGQGQPDNGKGEDGDYYLDLTNAKLYGPKTQGAWGGPSLDLKGLPGQDGQPGTNGITPTISEDGYWVIDGVKTSTKAQGDKGQDGHTPVFSVIDGYWAIDGVKTSTKAQGDKGQDGHTPVFSVIDGYWAIDGVKTSTKAQGDKGQDGHTPVFSVIDGYWAIDGVKTTTKAQGEQGTPGQNGADGSKILAEDRAPQATDGVKGDYFIDKAAKIFYGPKTDAGWPTTGISLVPGNTIATADYQLSPDGKTLEKWLNPKTHFIDMNADPKLKLVEKIGINAFNSQTNSLTYQLRTIIIGEHVREIEGYAFNQCKKLEKVEIPEGITKVDSGTFSNCYNLSSVTLPESLIEVGNGAFSSCIKLYTIVLPKNVNTIGNNAFKNCPNLHSIVLENRTAFQIKPLQFGIDNTTNLQNIFIPKRTKSAYESLITDATYKAKLKEIGI